MKIVQAAINTPSLPRPINRICLYRTRWPVKNAHNGGDSQNHDGFVTD